MDRLRLPKTQPTEKRHDILDPTKPRYDPTVKTRRYRAGQAPDYIEESQPPSKKQRPTPRPSLPSQRAAVNYEHAGLRRRRRADTDDEDTPTSTMTIDASKNPSGKVTAISDRSALSEPVAEVLHYDGDRRDEKSQPVAEVLEDSEDEEEKRRERRRRKDAEIPAEPITELLEEEEEIETNEEVEESQKLLKPLYREKEKRKALIAAREEELLQQKIDEEEIERLKMEKESESKLLLEETVKQINAEEEEERLRKELGQEEFDDEELPNDEISDEEKAYEDWKLRELSRLKRDYVLAQQREIEEAEIERRREMTEDERKKDDRRLDKLQPKKAEQGQMQFMQKYYHKGAFYQDIAEAGSEEVFKRDFNAPIAADAVDKSLLPAVMRVRRGDWGKKGRSKHTHLRDVDTTDRSVAWASRKNILYEKQREKMAGLKSSDQFERPSSRKR